MTAPLPTPDEHAATLTALAAAVIDDCRRFSLYPTSVAPGIFLGSLSVYVTLPEGQTEGVDAVAGSYGLPADDKASDVLYLRQGAVTVADRQVVVTVSTARPEWVAAQAAAALAAVPEPVQAIAAPVKVPSVRAQAVTR